MHVIQATNEFTILFLSQFQIGEIFTLPKYLPVTYVLISSVSIPRIVQLNELMLMLYIPRITHRVLPLKTTLLSEMSLRDPRGSDCQSLTLV